MKLSEQHINNAIGALSQTEEGRFFLGNILERCGTFAQSADFDNPYKTYAKEGMRAIGLWLAGEMGNCQGRGFVEQCRGECLNVVGKEQADEGMKQAADMEDPFGVFEREE